MMISEEMVNFLYAPSEQETIALQYVQHKETQMLYSKRNDLLKLRISSAWLLKEFNSKEQDYSKSCVFFRELR